MFKKYRKKPVVISAMQWEENVDYFIDFLKQNNIIITDSLFYVYVRDSKLELRFRTLEGIMTANIGDWIIIGVNGELYPCKDEIFKKTYEEVKE